MKLDNWDRVGQRVQGMYLGEIPFKGMVSHSRVKYGGKVQHTVALTDLGKIHWENVQISRDHILVNEEDLYDEKP